MAKVDENPTTPLAVASKLDRTPDPSLKDQHSSPNSAANSSRHRATKLNNKSNDRSPPRRNPLTAEEFVLSVASKYASQPLQYSDPDVWGVLTAISDKARKRSQGINILLTSGEHRIGRMVGDSRFQISSPAVSAMHCMIYRKKVASGDTEHGTSVFLKDTSTNGTYLNWIKLNKSYPDSILRHGDIISIAFAPHHELAFAFVFREVFRPTSSADAVAIKRKAEEFGCDNKRLKGIGIGTAEGPISLDDFRSLQRSNTELRKQLEDQVAKIEALRNEHRVTVENHESEMKDLRDSVSKSYHDQIKELNRLLEFKDKECIESSRISAEQKHNLEDLNERLNASEQSCIEANEIINSQKASILELKALLDEEREQRKEEREKAASDLKASIQRAQAEAREELNRYSDAALRREKEQQEMINKLQESEKERCSLVEALRVKLEETRQKLVISDNKARQLEAQMQEEQLASVTSRKRIDDLEHEMEGLRKELETEKAAREEAWAKVSVLELEINSAIRDLDYERRRLKAARERIMLRETQLRAFYSTTEEISVLFGKQQEQLRAMQKTLEDEENYENTSLDLNIEPKNHNANNGSVVGERGGGGHCFNAAAAKTGSTNSTHRNIKDLFGASSEGSMTEKHDCTIRSQHEDGQGGTQEVEFTSGERCKLVGFGSDINAPIIEGDPVGTEQINETGDNLSHHLVGTETVAETESQESDQRNIDTNQFDGGDTMNLDGKTDEARKNPLEGNINETEEVGETVRTCDLLSSEVAGSRACSAAAPSSLHHAQNGSQRSRGNTHKNDGSSSHSLCVPESQSSMANSTPPPPPPPTTTTTSGSRRDHDRKALSEMIGIFAPDLKEQFGHAVGDDKVEESGGIASDSETESCTDSDNEEVADTEVGSAAAMDAKYDDDDDDEGDNVDWEEDDDDD
ncbi:unnamed protein product [Cuscuta campestris]|uniref:FHA domain-containing protein n=1 Tax=Cuscuta campestris TaxID=132261 RepID=A0A484N0L0_9ASTE|nr:unnamed protein product [Cuscuta campestris]